MLLIALTIGMYYAWKDRTGNLADYFFGSKSLHPVSLSYNKIKIKQNNEFYNNHT